MQRPDPSSAPARVAEQDFDGAAAPAVEWSPASPWAGEAYRSPDIAAAARAVLDRAGWANGDGPRAPGPRNGSPPDFQARYSEAGTPSI